MWLNFICLREHGALTVRFRDGSESWLLSVLIWARGKTKKSERRRENKWRCERDGTGRERERERVMLLIGFIPPSSPPPKRWLVSPRPAAVRWWTLNASCVSHEIKCPGAAIERLAAEVEIQFLGGPSNAPRVAFRSTCWRLRGHQSQTDVVTRPAGLLWKVNIWEIFSQMQRDTPGATRGRAWRNRRRWKEGRINEEEAWKETRERAPSGIFDSSHFRRTHLIHCDRESYWIVKL